jgi:hypothetical protein
MDLKELENLLDAMDRGHARAMAEAEAAYQLDRAKLVAQIAEFRRIASKYSIASAAPTQPPKPSMTMGLLPPQLHTASGFDGSLTGLIHSYLTNPNSPVHGLRHGTRQNYASLLKRMGEGYGATQVADLGEEDIKKMHDGWAGENGDKIAMAHSMITMLRTLVVFGVTVLNDDGCRRLSFTLHRMKFKVPLKEPVLLNANQARLIIEKAKDLKFFSIGAAQALQFACQLRQKDVIGEWTPADDPEVSSNLVHRGMKWARGVCWEEIDPNMILRHKTSKEGKTVEVHLRSFPQVVRELRRVGFGVKKSGPIIVCENTGFPWTAIEFRRQWRKIARECGIKDEVKNRTGGSGELDIDETFVADAEAGEEDRVLN